MRYPLHIAALLILFSLSNAIGSGTGTMSILGGTVSGTGTISGTVSVGIAGSVAPGAAVGTLPIDGAMNLSAMADGGTGKLSFGLGPLVAGPNDKITVAGTLTIGSQKLDFGDFIFTPLSGFEMGTYTLITSTGISGTLATSNLSGTVGNYTATVGISGNDIILTVAPPLYATWANTYLPGNDVRNPLGNNDGDSLINFLEYAFGTDPTSSTPGSISYVANGEVTSPGLTVASNLAGSGVDYRAVFGRRKDYLTAKLTYAVQFSAILNTWATSLATPTVLTNSTSDIEAVSVPYPLFISTSNGVEKPTFFRVAVTYTP